MSEGGASGSGAVHPIRIPDWIREPAERWWREMPAVARLFVGLTALDVVGRSVGFLSPAIAWGFLTPLGFVTAFVPHDLWILLPALLIIRRPDAPAATLWIFGAALVVAIVEVARGPVQAILYVPSLATIGVLVGAAAGLALAAGWALLGRGLSVLAPRNPSPTVAGIATIAVALLGILIALYLAEAITAPAFGDAAYNQAVTLGKLAGTIEMVAWTYLMWVVIRGLGDPWRPVMATNLAGTGAIMAACIVPVTSVLARLLGAVGVDLSGGSGFAELFQIVSWLGDIAGPTLIAAAFALGLAEPPTPYQAPEAPSQPPETPSQPPATPSEPPEPAEAPSAP
ncbi:MAG TPA: hypothetical protein VJ506_08295 [Candidatus Limnocylindrales bacterium]|nr:hypothetical protein [Candidatus Limnocylindrales bacterium]